MKPQKYRHVLNRPGKEHHDRKRKHSVLKYCHRILSIHFWQFFNVSYGISFEKMRSVLFLWCNSLFVCRTISLNYYHRSRPIWFKLKSVIVAKNIQNSAADKNIDVQSILQFINDLKKKIGANLKKTIFSSQNNFT